VRLPDRSHTTSNAQQNSTVFSGNPLWLIGVYAPVDQKLFFKCLKILKKILNVRLHILCSLTKFCKKMIIFVTCVKNKKKLCYKIAIYVTVFCLFYTGHKKYLLTLKLWWMDIECSDAYQKFFVQIFDFFKYI
jgi:hypothetical protein